MFTGAPQGCTSEHEIEYFGGSGAEPPKFFRPKRKNFSSILRFFRPLASLHQQDISREPIECVYQKDK